MFSRRSFGIMLLASLVAFGAMTQVDAAKGPGRGGRNKEGKVEGTLVAVSAFRVVIRVRNGTEIGLTVNSATKVEHNDVHVPVTSLPVGARAQALYDPATLIATKVETNS